MSPRYAVWAAVSLIASLTFACASGQDPGVTIASLRGEADAAKLEVANATLRCLPGGVLQVEPSAGAESAYVKLRAGKAYTRRDWSRFGGVAVDVNSRSDECVVLGLGIADGKRRQRAGSVRLYGRERATVALLFESAVPGMRGAPIPLPGGSRIISNTWGLGLDYSDIAVLWIALTELPERAALRVSNVRWLPRPRFDGIVDRFGQFTRGEWPGKVHDEHDLADLRGREAAWLKSNPPPPDRDQWGGWRDGPRLEATGCFRTAQHAGKWWLVTPDGTLFFSIGITGVAPFHEGPVSGREYMFARLPKPGSPLAEPPFMQTGRVWWRSDDVAVCRIRSYAMNLYRKYGANWLGDWADVSCQRLTCWGFNTLANWSSPDVCDKRRLPYVVRVDYAGLRKLPAVPGSGPITDFFDEKFPQVLGTWASRQTPRWRDDPWCIGYFVDNELMWESWDRRGLAQTYAIVRAALAADAGQPAKREFVARLKAKYGRVEAFNGAWRTRCESWEALAAEPLKLPAGKLTPAARADCSGLLSHFARRYFTVVRDTLRRLAPNHLYLGCRFAVRPREVVQVAAQFCDVVSFNIYEPRLKQADWAFTDTLGRPAIIGEFGFGATDRGMFHYGAIPARNQAERGRAYQDYVRSVLQRPAFVGCHWFQYVDQELAGRFDGENYNSGFVAITDSPHPEMRDAALEINSQIYRVRGGEPRAK